MRPQGDCATLCDEASVGSTQGGWQMSASVLRWCLGLALVCLGACARDRLYEDTDGGSQEQDASGDTSDDAPDPDDANDDALDTTTDLDADDAPDPDDANDAAPDMTTDPDAQADADVGPDVDDVGPDVDDVGQDLPDLDPGCVDQDRDGVPGEACEGWDEPLDCDDANDARHFALREACDGLDNDCDGVVDEEACPVVARDTLGGASGCSCDAAGGGRAWLALLALGWARRRTTAGSLRRRA
jgi:hypothetical protein